MMRHAKVFAALGDETRLQLMARLRDEGPTSITKLAEEFPITRQAITKHLRVMEDAGVVHSVSRGRETLWSLSARWDARLARLKSLIEG
ncbi:MAG TPA: metalloregulator ArsR/SmtB family transcription factor [Vicinamibacterales bacterium]|nr:metalloregulator ArsR/SmtB family transcription factor [Vicinamibacterales bacterium]